MFEWIWKEEGDLVQELRVDPQQDETRKEESTV